MNIEEIRRRIIEFEAEYLPSGLRDTPEWLAVLAASGIETEGHDREAGHGAKHESPTAESGDANV